MARRRMIDPNMWQSEDFSNLSTLAKLVFIGLFSNADDEGRGRAKPMYIKSILFPYDEKIRVIDIENALSEIVLNLSVTFYSTDNGNQYYSLDNWKKWQSIDKPKPSQIPAPQEVEHHPPLFPDESDTSRRRVDDESCLNRKEKEREKEIEREKKSSICAEPETDSTPPVIFLPLNDGTDYPVTEEQCQEWAGLYPAVDVIQQLRGMRGWLLSNPEKRKTRRGVSRFITGWLAREQDKGGNKRGKQPLGAGPVSGPAADGRNPGGGWNLRNDLD